MKTSIFKYKVLSFLSGIIFLSGCVAIDVTPTDKFTDENYWTTQERANYLLNMAYRQMMGPDRLINNEQLSDNVYNGYSNNAEKMIVSGSAYDNNSLFQSEWSDNYGGIKTTHTFLANIDRVEDANENIKERMKAEARFIRAWLYFRITNWFGDIPFFTEDISTEVSQTIGRTPQKEIIEWIHQELEEVAEILPTKEQYSASDRGRITKGAALAFNARVALNFNDWERVIKYTDPLVNGTEYGSYDLFENYEGIFWKDNQYNKEIMLDIQYATEKRTWSHISIFLPMNLETQYVLAAPTQNLVDCYLMRDGSKWDESKDPYADRDLRLGATIMYPGSIVYRKDGSYYTLNVDPDSGEENYDRYTAPNSTPTGYYYRKFYDHNSAAWTNGTSWNCNINVPTIRFADVLLMYAEAKNELGELSTDEWNKTIKRLRNRAGFNTSATDYPGADSDELREVIRNERRVELALEGLRVFDIRRWKIAKEVLTQPMRGAKLDKSNGTAEYISYPEYSFRDDRDYLWAIPREERYLNSNLTQNPGY